MLFFGPFFRRELASSVRKTRAFTERRNALYLVATVILGAFLVWDRQGWDRASILGSRRFGLATFALVVVALGLFAFGLIVAHVGVSVASERDRKTLDALLASRFSSAEIVLGAVLTGLFRYLNAAMGCVPVIVLLVYLGGVAPVWAVLAGVGLASLALATAAIAVVVSVESKSAARASNYATGLFGIFLVYPWLYQTFRPLVWPGAPAWLTTACGWLVDASPLGLTMNLAGVFPKAGGPAWGVGRMVAWQLSGSILLIAWAMVRLRPASRGLYDVEGESSRLQKLRAALRRPPRRPACGADPVLWAEIHTSRVRGRLVRVFKMGVNLSLLAALVLATCWFAVPAFEELKLRGYGPMPEARSMPDLNPMARMLVTFLNGSRSMPGAAGQARLEFNIVLRQWTAMAMMAHIALAFAGAVESIAHERRRDTWLGLLMTPLSGFEILRAKMRGTFWKARAGTITLVSLWTVGLICGAIHPLGYGLGLALLAVTGVFYSSQGFFMALLECNPDRKGPPAVSIFQIPLVLVAAVALTAGPILLAWIALLTFEDVQSLIEAGPFVPIERTDLRAWMGARSVVLAWLTATSAMAVWAGWLVRTNEQGFDRSVGRPVAPGAESMN